MKFTYLLSFIIVISVFAACKNKSEIINNHSATDENKPVISFMEESFDFGIISQGEQVKHSFWFKNTGTTDLVLNGVIASCGCTVPDYSKDPIIPGDSSKIDVYFNTKGRKGRQYKTIHINSNAKTPVVTISFKADIIDSNNN